MTWWNGIAGAASSHMEGNAVRANINAENRIRQANADASNKVRRASNALASARGNLARFMQSVNNNESLVAAGKAQEANTRAGLQVQARLQQQGLFAQVSAAEQAGRATASQGALGIGGQVVDNVNAATTLRAAIMSDSLSKQKMSVAYDVGVRAQTIASQMTRSLDSSIILDSIDYRQDVPLIRQSYSNTQNAIRGFAQGMGQGSSLYTASDKEPAKAEKQDAVPDMRVKQSPSFTESYDSYQSRQGQLSTTLDSGVSNTDGSTNMAPLFGGWGGQTYKFNLNVDDNYSGL